jgi:anti-sigma factor RsiW
MKCPLEFDCSSELIVGYGARTLDSEAAAAFERHLDSCTACCKLVAAQKAVWAALDEANDDGFELPVSPDFDRRLFQRIEEAENRSWWLWRALVPVTACLALATLLLLRHPDSARTPQIQPPQPAVQIEQVKQALDDMDLLDQLGAPI